jgi:hypothetical protein
VRAVDSHPENPYPAVALRGLLEASESRSELIIEILDREFVVYDALYAECKRQAGKL